MWEYIKRNWPWWVALGWLAGYEIYALITRIPGSGLWRPPTLSQIVWWGYDRAAYLPWIVIPAIVVLLIHFFAHKRNPPDAQS